MDLVEPVKIALSTLRHNKLRALLTMLGVIIGVAAVVTLLALGAAVRELVIDRFQTLGSNLIFLYSDTQSTDQLHQVPPELTNDDLAALSDPLNVPAVTAVAAEFIQSGVTTYGRATHSGAVAGVTANYPQVRTFELLAGSSFDALHSETRARVAVLGYRAYRALFGDADPIGARVQINGANFEVIGVFAERGGTFAARDDEKVFVPLHTAQYRLFPPAPLTIRRVEISIMYIQTGDERALDAALAEITALLRERRHLTYQDNNFAVLTQSDLIDSFGAIVGVLTAFLGSVAAISLFVGGIGIMNIMLVSVSERTREIGLRRAMGARRADIRAQFLVEALVLSVLGGAIGLLSGVLLTALGSLILQRFAEGISAQVQPLTVALAIGTSLAVGLVFGLYPAHRAAQLNPIDALRYE